MMLFRRLNVLNLYGVRLRLRAAHHAGYLGARLDVSSHQRVSDDEAPGMSRHTGREASA